MSAAHKVTGALRTRAGGPYLHAQEPMLTWTGLTLGSWGSLPKPYKLHQGLAGEGKGRVS